MHNIKIGNCRFLYNHLDFSKEALHAMRMSIRNNTPRTRKDDVNPSRAERKSFGEVVRGERSAKEVASRKKKKIFNRTPAKPVFTPRGAAPGTTRGKPTRPSSRANSHFEKPMPDFPMRLNKYIAVKGDMTRSEADQIIAGGSITINGVKATLGAIIRWDDKIEGLRTK
jgi:hypothetical protein